MTDRTKHVLQISWGAILLMLVVAACGIVWRSGQEQRARVAIWKGMMTDAAVREKDIRQKQEEIASLIAGGNETVKRLLESSRRGIISSNRDGVITYVNDALADWVHSSPENLIGARIEKILAPEVRLDYLTRRKEAFADSSNWGKSLVMNCELAPVDGDDPKEVRISVQIAKDGKSALTQVVPKEDVIEVKP